MRLIIEPDYEKMSKWAANYVAKCINEANPTADKPFKLGCPTGSSPLGMYRELIALNKAGKVSFQNVITFNMDEYVNLPESIFGVGEFYILRTYGDSMVDAGILPGTLVVIDKNAQPKKGDIVVVLNADNENTLKLYSGKKKGKYVFSYMNEEKYPGETIRLNSFTCQGVAKHVIKSF